MLQEQREMTPEVGALLAHAMFPDAARIETRLRTYLDGARVFVWRAGDSVLGAVGVRVDGAEASVLHIGVEVRARGLGVGRALVMALLGTLGLTTLRAETDDDAVGFYRSLGFTVTPVSAATGQRYVCVLRVTS